jgi:putative membrane protein
MGLGFVALYTIGRPRHGVAVVVGKLLAMFTLKYLILLLSVMLVAGSLAVFLTLIFARIFAKNITKVRYKSLCLGVIILMVILTVLLSGWLSLLVLATATSIGIVASLKGIRRMHLMGCLLLPVILYFLL